MEDEEGRKLEPYEEATVECPTEFTGACVDLLGSRAGQMLDMQANDVAGTTTIKFRVPTRGLIGLRNAMLTASKGNAVLNTIFDGYGEWSGDLNTRANGSLVAHETGQTTQYALKDIQERGTLFMGQGEKIYKGQVIGIHQRFGDLRERGQGQEGHQRAVQRRNQGPPGLAEGALLGRLHRIH